MLADCYLLATDKTLLSLSSQLEKLMKANESVKSQLENMLSAPKK